VTDKPRDRILSTAIRLFYRETIQTVGVNQIIAEADVAPMTLYRQFGSKDQLVAAALEQWSGEWLRWLSDQVDRCGDDPETRLAGLWEALAAWFTREEYCGSFVANAASELRNRPDHPAQKVILEHRMALRQLLEDLAKAAGAYDPARAAGQLFILLEGAVAIALLDRRHDIGADVRRLAKVALIAEAA
jgi:AcrR family transcriptional regulator